MHIPIRIVVLILLPILIALLTYKIMRAAFIDALDKNNKAIVLVEIESGKTFKEICQLLKEKKIIRRAWGLNFVARLKKYDTGINAGEYELSPSMSPTEILQKLASGEVFKRSVTVKEGMSVWEIGELVEQAGLISRTEFDAAIADPKLLAVGGISAPSFEGYLFPETYQFSRPITAKQVIWRMLEEGEKRWPVEYTAQADRLGLARHEILTLASIIEKESGSIEEQPIISSVFHNRLANGMKLQADPTVIYGIPNFNGNLTKEDLQNPTPYNTYTNYGLPPGPIANPGESAIKAALFPSETSYLFFVATGDGNHVFSTTLQEHNDAVNRYQRNRGKAAAPPAPAPADIPLPAAQQAIP